MLLFAVVTIIALQLMPLITNANGRIGREQHVRQQIRKLMGAAEEIESDEPTLSKKEIIEQLEAFEENHYDFPIKTNDPRYNSNLTFAKMGADMAEAHFIAHSEMLPVMEQFLALKREKGSDIEKRVYRGMDAVGLMDRLIKKRVIQFINRNDQFLSRDMDMGAANGKWESIGTENENTEDPELPLGLAEYLSYDEMLLSTLIGVSSPTQFINDGDRFNAGYDAYEAAEGAEDSFIREGYMIGLVGPRFEKTNVMEHALMVVTEKQNQKDLGFGEQTKDVWALMARMFGLEGTLPLWEDFKDSAGIAIQKRQYVPLDVHYQPKYFNVEMYKSRMRLSLELLLLEANDIGMREMTKSKGVSMGSFVHIAGLGLGVWAVNDVVQARLFLEVVRDVLDKHRLRFVKAIDFAYFPIGGNLRSDGSGRRIFDVADGAEKEEIGKMSCRAEDYRDVAIIFSVNNPSSSSKTHVTTREIAELTLVESFAWDPNALVGNEYWVGSLTDSGDSAAAASSTIPFVQNTLINPHLNAQNTRIYGMEGEAPVPMPVAMHSLRLGNVQKLDSGDHATCESSTTPLPENKRIDELHLNMV